MWTAKTAALTEQERDEAYKAYHNSVNMTYSELKEWSDDECSHKASLDRSPITRNLELLNTAKAEWTSKHVRWSRRTIAFIARMRRMQQGQPVSRACPISKRDISLKNWAFDPGK